MWTGAIRSSVPRWIATNAKSHLREFELPEGRPRQARKVLQGAPPAVMATVHPVVAVRAVAGGPLAVAEDPLAVAEGLPAVAEDRPAEEIPLQEARRPERGRGCSLYLSR